MCQFKCNKYSNSQRLPTQISTCQHMKCQSERVFSSSIDQISKGVVFSQRCPSHHCSQPLNPNFLSHWARVFYGNETFEQRSHKVGHISEYEAIPTHKIMSPSFFKKSFQESIHLPLIRLVSLRTMFPTKHRWIWQNWERIFPIIGPRRKSSLIFYTGVMVLYKCQKYRCHGRIGALLEWPWENNFFS